MPDVKSRWEEAAKDQLFRLLVWQQSPGLNSESPFLRICSFLGSLIYCCSGKNCIPVLGGFEKVSSIRFDHITARSPQALRLGQQSHMATIILPFMGKYSFIAIGHFHVFLTVILGGRRGRGYELEKEDSER